MTMTSPPKKSESCVWNAIRDEAAQRAASEPMLASFLHATVLNHERMADAVSYHLAGKLASSTLSAMQLREIMLEAMNSDQGITEAICADIQAVQERDPAVKCSLVPLCSLREFTRCRRIESPTGCGNRNANYSLFSAESNF